MKRGNRSGRRGAWALAAIAGLCVASPAWAQFARAVNPDQSVTAEDAMLRVRELGEAGNTSEALRVLQQLLETDADRMVPVQDTQDPERFESVRAACHRLLLGWPELLTRYRAAEEQNALRQLAEGKHREVERSRFMTQAGLEATLRIAQEDLEAGRFEAARMRLEECDEHPDAKGPLAKDRAQLAIEAAHQIGRDAVRAWAEALAREAGVQTEANWNVRRAPARYAQATTGLDAQPPIDAGSIGAQALNSLSPSGDGMAEAIIELEGWGQDKFTSNDGTEILADATESAMFGASVGGLVLINDGYTVACLDSATLGVRWRTVPPQVMGIAGDFEEDWSQPMIGGREAEPSSSVAAGSGVVVAGTKSSSDEFRGVTGLTLHGMDIATGKVLWSVSPARLDPSLSGAEFDGPVMIQDDVAIVSLSRSGLMRRESELQLVGIDLFRGTVRWIRRMGSVGVQPWLRQEARPEALLLHQGVVYRATDLGVLGAYEASTGRPLWVRRLSTARVEELQFRVRTNSALRPFQLDAPVADGQSILCHDATGNKILRVDAANGKLLGSRDASAFGDVQYMLRVGEYLTLVGDRHVSIVKANAFEDGLVRMVARFGEAGIVGRCVASGGKLLVPIAGGLVEIDPANPDAPMRADRPAPADVRATGADAVEDGDGEGSGELAGTQAGETDPRGKPTYPLARAGNPLVVELGNGTSTLVIAERSLVSTYLRWEKAQEILHVRAASEPGDPTPLLTMIELGSRAGRYEEIPALSDRVLALADLDPLSSASAAARSRLFELLSEMTRKARRVWQEDGAKGAVPPELLSRILGAMGRSAETPEELVTHAFAEAWLHEIRRDSARAIESYQGVLADPRLAQVELKSEDRTDPERLAAPVTSVGTAGPEAARRVLGALRQAGIGAYAGFEDEARRAVESSGDDPTLLAGVAERYPGSMAALEALDRACAMLERSATEKDSSAAVLTLAARGLELSRAQTSAAREEAWPMAGAFLGRVVARIQQTRPEGALRLVRAIEAERPDLNIPGVATATAASLAREISERIRSRQAEGGNAPEFGGVLRPMAQPMEGWMLQLPLIRSEAFSSREATLMYSAAEGKLALWTRSATGDRFVAAWTRDARTQDVTPILVTPEETILLATRTAEDGSIASAIECIETSTGRVRWKSEELGVLLNSGDAITRPRANERINTPMDGQVRGSDLVAVAMGRTAADGSIWLVARDGRFAALGIRTGEVTARGACEITRVYDVDAQGGRVAITGATYRPGVSGLKARVEVRDAKGGLVGAVDGTDAGPGDASLRLDFGDHARFARVASNGDVLIGSARGLALVGTAPGQESGLVERWSRDDDGVRGLAGAWLTPDGKTLMAVDAQSTVVTLDPRTGVPTQDRPETTSRVAIPLDVIPVRGRAGASDSLAISSANGLVLIGPDGALVGADGITPKGNLAPAALGATRAACVELFAGARDVTGESTGRLRVAILDLPFARVISTASLVAPGEVSGTMALDDTLLITTGDSTIVIDAPRD